MASTRRARAEGHACPRAFALLLAVAGMRHTSAASVPSNNTVDHDMTLWGPRGIGNGSSTNGTGAAGWHCHFAPPLADTRGRAGNRLGPALLNATGFATTAECVTACLRDTLCTAVSFNQRTLACWHLGNTTTATGASIHAALVRTSAANQRWAHYVRVSVSAEHCSGTAPPPPPPPSPPPTLADTAPTVTASTRALVPPSASPAAVRVADTVRIDSGLAHVDGVRVGGVAELQVRAPIVALLRAAVRCGEPATSQCAARGGSQPPWLAPSRAYAPPHVRMVGVMSASTLLLRAQCACTCTSSTT